MNSTPHHPVRQHSDRRIVRRRLVGWLLLGSALGCTAVGAEGNRSAPGGDGSGTISGLVSNLATRNLLEGARVELPALGISTLTDPTGRYVLRNVTTGEHIVTAAYTGLDQGQLTVRVQSGAQALANFDLSSGVYALGEYVVTGEREGNALAITSQRNAENVKNVVALDAFGNLPNMSAGELAVRLPGVASQLDDEGNVTGVVIRGTAPGLNRVTVDGNLISNVGGFGRNFQMHSLTGAMFEQLEVIKGHTPDQSADSVGGSVNLKTRSPLSMKERRRINYSFGARWAPPFFDHNPSRRDHPIHPQTNLAYQEVFDAFGGDRNLGVALNVFYSENVNAPGIVQYDYQNTTNSPAYIWDFRTADRYSNRRQVSLNLKSEYRVSPATKLIFNAIYNDANEAFNRVHSSRAFTNQVIATLDASGQPTGTGAILPGFTATRTQVRGVAASMFELSSLFQTFFNRTRLVNLGAEHELDRWRFDYDASYSQTHNNLGHGEAGAGGALIMRVPNVGWVLDTSDPEKPVFTQTAGASIFDVASYRNNVQHTLRDDARDIDVLNAKVNALYRAGTSFPLMLKGGAFWRRHKVAEVNGTRRWNYAGTAPLPGRSLAYATAWEAESRQVLPYVETTLVYRQLGDAALWSEDLYFGRSQRYSATRNATEDIGAGYVMAQAKVGRLGVVAGVRSERTEVTGNGFVRVRPATAAEIPDPVERAEHDWNNPVANEGSYTRSFPSIHFAYDISPNLKARASWSTSFGRPAFGSLVPSATINEAQQTVTINNPGLGPQYSENTDVTLEYYFKPAGLISLGYFTKDIEDFILTSDVGVVGAGNDNGFEGNYSGYTLRSQRNTGGARIRGWEFDYRQQFTFLPGWMSGFGLAANYTHLDTKGDFGGSTTRSKDEVAGFIPQTGNASLSYSHRGFGVRFLGNYTGDYLGTFAEAPARRVYRRSRTILNFGLSYQWRPAVSVFLDLSNLTNEPQRTYRYIPSQVERTIYTGTAITFGVSGRF